MRGHRNHITSSWLLRWDLSLIKLKFDGLIWMFSELWWIESSTFAGRPDCRGTDALESHLWIRWWLPRCWLRLSDCLWYLSAKTCKFTPQNLLELPLIHIFIDSRTNFSALHRHFAQFEWYESPLVLRQRRRLCEHDGSCVKELRAAMGWNADFRSIHRHWSNHGMGQ